MFFLILDKDASKMLFKNTWDSFLDLLFPRVCLVCTCHLNFYEKMVCLSCQTELPLTHFNKTHKNTLYNKLKLNFPLENAIALFYFEKEGKVAQMIHQFKYLGQPHIGIYLGHWLGDTILASPYLKKIDGIIPVPLHPSKMRKRGYNQAAIIASALSEKLNIPVMEKTLIRIKKTQSLAQVGYEERWREVDQAFESHLPLPQEMTHFLLVDDVITTGATLSACASALLKKKPLKLSIVSLACRL